MSWPIAPTGRLATTETRFWEQIDKVNFGSCWIWTGAVTQRDYGTIGSWKAHRVSWELHNGKIFDGLFVCHHCDNRSCVNPKHLFLGENVHNMQDLKFKRQYLDEYCGRGHWFTNENSTVKTNPAGIKYRLCHACFDLEPMLGDTSQP